MSQTAPDGVADASAPDALVAYLRAIVGEFADLGLAGGRARTATRIALSVVAAVTLAQIAHLDDPWWAGISGLMTSQATGPASVRRCMLRIVGTAAGATLGYFAMGIVAYDHVAFCIALFLGGFIGMLGLTVSKYGYAWLLGGLTANMIILISMETPASTPFVAFDRFAQVSMGALAALVMALLLADDTPEAVAPAPGWRDLLGAQWPAVMHAMRGGIAVMTVPVIWTYFDLPGLLQMAVTVIAVMALPIASEDTMALAQAVAGRAVQRLSGCLCGGTLGLLCLTVPLTIYWLWLLALFGGVWVFAHISTSARGLGYAGLQACLVFIMTLVQGYGPPDSILPGIDRFAGIGGGLAVLLLVSLLLWPAPPPARDPA